MYNVKIINDIQNMTLQAMFDVPWNIANKYLGIIQWDVFIPSITKEIISNSVLDAW